MSWTKSFHQLDSSFSVTVLKLRSCWFPTGQGKGKLPVFIVNVNNILILLDIRSQKGWNEFNFLVLSCLLCILENTCSDKVDFIYVGCLLIRKKLKTIIHAFHIILIFSTCTDSSLRRINCISGLSRTLYAFFRQPFPKKLYAIFAAAIV